MAITVHKEMPNVQLTKEEFKRRYWQRFYDPAFGTLTAEIDRLAEVAWDVYENYRKSPYTRPAGPASPIRTTNCRTNGASPAKKSERRNGGRKTRHRRRAFS
jgi:hypothetical protein